MTPTIKIIVATHKKYWMPQSDCYLPLHVGKANSPKDIGFIGDNTGDNISQKNATFCELTGVYWMWKNIDADYLGIVHYRRHFVKHLTIGKHAKRKVILNKDEFLNILQNTDIILPKKRHYYIETNRQQYEHAHNPNDISILEQILQEQHASYLPAFNYIMSKTSGHRFNMFVMKKSAFDKYCTWLFDILFELEQRIDISNYNEYNSRVFGFIGERLLDVWIEANKIKYTEQKVLFMEHMNWFIKGKNFIARKIKGGINYEK